MAPLAFACIAPHGSEILEELCGGNPALMARTRASLKRLGESMREAAPDTLVVLTPHGTRVEGQFAVTAAERVRGRVEDHGGVVTMERPVDRALARAIGQAAAEDGLPAALLGFITSEGPLSCLPLDWGAIIPLHFMPEVPVVVVNPPRGTDFGPHLRFGGALARVVDLIRRGDLEALASLDPSFVEDAKPDGLWQALVLAGAIPPESRRTEFLSYEAPTYFGLLCAGFWDKEGGAGREAATLL